MITTSMRYILGLVLVCGLAACGSAPRATTTPTPTPPGTTPPTTPPAHVSIGTTQIQVKSDNSDSATITATVLDAGNAAVANAQVNFASTGGMLSSAVAFTDSYGQARTIFAAGTLNPSNQVQTVTATVANTALTTSIPITVAGSTVTATSANTNLTTTAPGNTDTLTLTAKNAGGIPVPNVPVTITQTSANGGLVTFSATTGTTNAAGQVVVTVTGSVAGSVTVSASALGATGTVSYTVTTVAAAFAITAPVAAAGSLTPTTTTNTNVTVTVQAPAPTANVTFATSMGAWDGGALSVVTKAVAAGTVSAIFNSTTAGVSTIQVYDAANPAKTASIKIAVSAPATAASQIALQSNISVVAPSLGNTANTATLTATVRDAYGQPVGNAPVQFTVANPTGSGEFISPVVSYTNAAGVATSTFTSGTQGSSALGIDVNAIVLGTAIPASVVNIVIGGTGGSVVLGIGTTITTLNATTYAQPMAVQVVDQNGNPVNGAVVSLKAFPMQFKTGYWRPTVGLNASCIPHVNQYYKNEDVNSSLTLDPGEDGAQQANDGTLNAWFKFPATSGSDFLLGTAGNGALDPGNSAGGNVPATVTTDATGTATFDLTFLKQYSSWVVQRVTASTTVFGTAKTTSMDFTLPWDRADSLTCVLPNSNWGGGYDAPIASGALPIDAYANTAVSFNSTGSILSASGSAAYYTWDHGDGSISSILIPPSVTPTARIPIGTTYTHTYTVTATYRPCITVTDQIGQTSNPTCYSILIK